NGKAIAQMDGVIDSLSHERVLQSYDDAIKEARLIDCIWFRNGKLMPAVMEIEHSTGIKSGLTRMKQFCDFAPRLQDIRWTIVAPDEYRSKVIEFSNMPQFRELDAKFFPYSAVEELYSLCERRKPQGITDQFLDSFMEKCIKH
ncbi:TPA: restriction endonuclease, partial [Klebsiella quasipneumoniae subsp. similipneumoniae]|nr:restriction endonuclease [Klebsiella quasipneumoniae subsp. similipneumoniae]